MKTLTIKDLTKTEELDHKAMDAVHGGMMNLRRFSHDQLLKSPDGEPVTVIVDGVVVNSVTTGYAPK
jgi:hypothetical protein